MENKKFLGNKLRVDVSMMAISKEYKHTDGIKYATHVESRYLKKLSFGGFLSVLRNPKNSLREAVRIFFQISQKLEI